MKSGDGFLKGDGLLKGGLCGLALLKRTAGILGRYRCLGGTDAWAVQMLLNHWGLFRCFHNVLMLLYIDCNTGGCSIDLSGPVHET